MRTVNHETLAVSGEQNTPISDELADAERREKLLTKAQVAQFAQCTTRCIDVWMRKGHLPYLKIGRTVRFNLSDVEAHLEANFRVVRRRLPAVPGGRLLNPVKRGDPENE